ncbi:MAG TPA: response regulator [Sandaracinaceae bacterium]
MSDGGLPSILVLDDDPLVRRAIQRVAAGRRDVTVETVGTPDEVLARVDAGARYDLIVCDYRLTLGGVHTSSAELVRELTRRGQRVAVMTGDVDTIAPDLAHVPALEKPLRLDDILAHLSPGS